MDKKQLKQFKTDYNGIAELFVKIGEDPNETVTLEIPNLTVQEVDRINLVASEFCYDLLDMETSKNTTYLTYENSDYEG